MGSRWMWTPRSPSSWGQVRGDKRFKLQVERSSAETGQDKGIRVGRPESCDRRRLAIIA